MSKIEQYETKKPLKEEKTEPPIYEDPNYYKAFKYRLFFESYMRKFIVKKLKEYHKERWWKDGFPGGVQNGCKDRKRRDPKGIGKQDKPEIFVDYMDFSDYWEVIRPNWKKVFKDCFEKVGFDDTQVNARLKDLAPIRNIEAHSKEIIRLTEKEVRKYEDGILDLCVDEHSKKEFEDLTSRLAEPIMPPPPELPPSKHIPIDKSILYEVTTLNALYELTKNGNFLEKPLKEEEWKSKREEVITFNERVIEDAITKLTTHRILLISGQPNVGKSTFLLFFLDKCLERGIKDWRTVIFLNPAIKEKDFDSVLEDVNTFIQSKYGQNNVLLAIDGLHRRESDDNYVNKCLKLFEKASHSGYKLIATLRDGEKEFLKNRLENLGERDIDEWAKFEPIMEEIKLAYKTEELKRILANYLNLYREKIKLQNISFDDMNMYVREAVNIPPEKIEQYQRFNDCMEIVVLKSEGLAGYIAFLIKDIAEHEGEFSKEIVKKYPIGMVNIILNTIWRDYYVENDDLIPLFIIFLTKLTELDGPVNYMTKHFFDSFKMWGIEVLDKELKKEDKEKILKKIENFVNSFTIRTTFLEEDEYSLLNYWNDAIEEAIHKGKYDKGNKNYNRIVDEFKDAEKNWKYLIKDNYIPVTVNQLENRNETFFSLDRPRSDVFYLVGDIAKLWSITDPNVLDSSTAFFKEYRQKYAESLPLQFDFLKKTLSLLWRMKAEDFLEKSSDDPAIASYKEAIDIDNDDYRSYWEIGGFYERKGEKHKALDCYTESANKQGTSKGYGVLASKVSEYRKEYSKKQGISEDFEPRYLELQENAATNAINCVGGEREHRNWGIFGEALRRKGQILNENEKYLKAIPIFEQAIMAYEEAVNVMIRLKQVPKDWYHWQIGYCHKNLAFTYNKLENLDEAKTNLKMAIDHFKLGAAREDCTKGYLKLAKLMSREDFYSADNSACKEALEKVDVNELVGDDLVEYYWLWGKDYEHKQDFENALNKFNEAKNLIFSRYLGAMDISVQDEDEYTHELIDDLYQHIGSCYGELDDYNKAAENYMIYAGLDEYTPKGLSGWLYGIYGNTFSRWGFHKEAQRCFWKALKRNPQNAENLSKIAIANAQLGRLEEAISDLEKALEIRYRYEDEKLLSTYKERLKKRKEVSFVLESICDIADSAIEGTGGEKLSKKWYQVKMLLDGIDPREVAEVRDLILSSLRESIRLDSTNQEAKQTMTKLTDNTLAEIKEKYTINYHSVCATSLQEENKDPFSEIFHRIYAAAIKTVISIHKMNTDDTIKSKVKKKRKYGLSDEWGRIGWRIHKINGEHTSKIPHRVAEKCFELSVKLRPNNSTSLHNLGWVRHYIGLYTGDNNYYSKAREAFNESIRLEEKGEKEKNHILLSKIGIGITYEGGGDAMSAEKWFRDGATTCIGLHGESKEAAESLLKTAERLEHLRFLNVSDDEELRFMKEGLEVYEKALEIAEKINPNNTQTLLLREKAKLLEKQIRRMNTLQKVNNQEVEKIFGKIDIKTPLMDKTEKESGQSKRIYVETKETETERVEIERIEDIFSKISKKPEDYKLFEQFLNVEFDIKPGVKVMSKKKKEIERSLEYIINMSLGRASRDSPFEITAKVFQLCQKFCEYAGGEEFKQKFTDKIYKRMLLFFRSIIFGTGYHNIGCVESKEELISFLEAFRGAFVKSGVKIPSLDEIEERCRRSEKYEEYQDRVERLFGKVD